MMKETFNDKHQNYNTSLYFSKTGPLNPNHVFFIVTQSTASASELLINNLKPYMTVKLIGPSLLMVSLLGFSLFLQATGMYFLFLSGQQTPLITEVILMDLLPMQL